MLGRRAMLLPAQYAWFEPVLIATIVVFIIDLVGNSIGFGNRFPGALMSAIVFALRVRKPCLFRLRQRLDVSDDNAEYNCPCSNAKVGRPYRNPCSLAAAVRCSNLVVSVGVGWLGRSVKWATICEWATICATTMSGAGHSRRLTACRLTSGLIPKADVPHEGRHFRKVPNCGHVGGGTV